MSLTPPLSPSSIAPITRTIAIIKNHALSHRFDIEPRIQEAGFEIVKERQMEFDVDSDPEYLYELFGDDADSLGEGPVWVYVLERRRAVEVFLSLMGPSDPAEAPPHSLRALYGLSAAQNGIMGSPDTHAAELQISSLFASSPPFPISDLPSVDSGVIASPTSGSLKSPPSTIGSRSGKNTQFKARGLPASHAAPDIVPRTTRAASLRAGVVVAPSENKHRVPLSKERLAKTFANVPGHKRAETIQVASTNAPAIKPRMTRAAALRLGIPLPEASKKTTPPTANGTKPKTDAIFEGIPGHKRRETISVPSLATRPSLAPRINKTSELRAQKDSAPPTSFMFRQPTTPKRPGSANSLSRSTSRTSLHSHPAALSRATSAMAVNRVHQDAALTKEPSKTSASKVTEQPKKKAPRPSSISAPAIVPRTNRSAALRAAQKEAETAKMNGAGVKVRAKSVMV
ncbi:uncharacterized protein BT62DRAFT_932939 [Guyanagaster necrorhizus]|uniref:Nucleoside diphosphate kinase n=1 Tax=Guyanagaster necrorhizus TaxID=856835 RepID=A0A9P7VTF8_9AGAR|nr:uncharacterized protein BT62DRAFT_932939 [Guyanagaster necrorhizus MCA 3950]KAG7445769.1 hypothetical protein BT62DRAFT_932939 [Guyanagaster necrorhizus MCA 3950]